MELRTNPLGVQAILWNGVEQSFHLRLGDGIVLFLLGVATIAYLGEGKVWGKPDPASYRWYEASQKVDDVQALRKNTRNIGEKLKQSNNDIAVFYGSQSGVSERFAERLAREWHSRFSLKTTVADMDDYDPEHLAQVPDGKLVVFLVSTYGEGDPPDNAVNFCTGLEKMRKKGTRLDGLRYLAMGMGNKNYKHYNLVIKVVDETLAALGAKRIGALGLGDESSGATEENFMDWKEAVLEELGSKITLVERPITYEPNIEIVNVCIDQHHVYHGEPSETALYNTQERVTYNTRNPYPAPIALTRTLSSLPNRSCVHFEFDLHAVPSLRYQTGDHLAVWPVNPDHEVDRLFRLLGVDDSQKMAPILIETKAGAARKLNLPSPTTREALLKYYLEIGGLASRDFLLLLSQYAPTEAAQETLIRLGKDKSAFRHEVAARYLSVGRVLEMVEPRHKWTKVPFTMLIESFSRLQPRRYSISSSPLVQPRQPAITMVVNNRQFQAREDTKEQGHFLGLATNFLLAHDRNLALQWKEAASQFPDESGVRVDYDLDGPRKKLAGGKVYLHIKRSTFKLPTKATTPIIMVGAGTGIAPFRGFVQERARLMELGKPIGQMVLFFGCRNEESDYLYRDEWKAYQEQMGDKLVVVPAFSRQKGAKKTYVQDAMYQQKELVAKLVSEMDAAFYICGAAAMARDVRARLVDVLAECGGKSKQEVEAYISGTMKKAALYHEDVWGN